MRNNPRSLQLFRDKQGVAMILVVIAIFAFIGFAALAIDIGHLFVVRNELKNAADAGSLAGARVLYNNNGTAVNAGANQVAFEAATANRSEKLAVDVNWSSGNTGDVERGHWSFATGEFNASPSLEPVDLWDVPTAVLDAWDPLHPFINAVRVTARREATPAASFFARIFGFENFILRAESVAYIGFAGTLAPGEVDQPIAICAQSISNFGNTQGNSWDCHTGRMLDSNIHSSETFNTAAWTSFEQPCSGASSANTVRNLVCDEGNPYTISLGSTMSTMGGVADSTLQKLINCWTTTTNRTGPWQMRLPVIDCPGNNTTACAQPVGAVLINILWINGNNPQWEDAPTQMVDPRYPTGGTIWRPEPTGIPGEARWSQFVNYFNLLDLDGNPADYRQKSIYFLPDCEPSELAGNTGGQNFGILARIPVLVK